MIKENRSHLGVNQPAMVERYVKQIEHDAFWGVLEDSHTGELHIHIQTCLQLVQHCHGIAHVLGNKENSPDELQRHAVHDAKTSSLVNLHRYIEPYNLLHYSWLVCTRQHGCSYQALIFLPLQETVSCTCSCSIHKRPQRPCALIRFCSCMYMFFMGNSQ